VGSLLCFLATKAIPMVNEKPQPPN